jgi:hypothetical protein
LGLKELQGRKLRSWTAASGRGWSVLYPEVVRWEATARLRNFRGVKRNPLPDAAETR